MPVYLGIDWSQNKHDLCFVNAAGAAVARATIPHSADGFLELDRLREKVGLPAAECWVGLETSHHLLVDFLWAKGYTQVFVLPPNMVKSTRGRYRQSGARNDQSDAFLLGDVLRTDQARLQPWHPDSLLTRQIRAKVGWHPLLTRETVRLGNRLRAVLARYYPAALHVFSDLTGPVSLQFVREFPTPLAASGLTRAQFDTFARQHGYRQIAKLPACFARLTERQPAASGETIQIYQTEAVQLADLLLTHIQLKHTVDRELLGLYRQHPDYATFHSLPGSGPVLGPALLAHFGDDRARFPSPAGLQALAGTCPVTDSAASIASSSSAKPAITLSGTPPSNGRWSRCALPLGRRPIGNKSGRAATPTVTPIGAWPTAGCPSLGSCGTRIPPITKTITCSSGGRAASRALPSTQTLRT